MAPRARVRTRFAHGRACAGPPLPWCFLIGGRMCGQGPPTNDRHEHVIKLVTRTLKRQRLNDPADRTGIGSPTTLRTDFASCGFGPVRGSMTVVIATVSP